MNSLHKEYCQHRASSQGSMVTSFRLIFRSIEFVFVPKQNSIVPLWPGLVCIAILFSAGLSRAQSHRVLAMCHGQTPQDEESAVVIEGALIEAIEASTALTNARIDSARADTIESVSSDVERLVKGAFDDLQNLDVEAAQTQLQSAEDLMALNSDRLDRGLAASVFLVRAVLYRSLGEDQKARDAFRTALNLSEAAVQQKRIALSQADQKILRAVAKTRKLKPLKTLKVVTGTTPMRIYIDGEFRGYSPVTARDLREGAHVVLAAREGFSTQVQMAHKRGDEIIFADIQMVAMAERIRKASLADTSPRSVFALINNDGLDALFCSVDDKMVNYTWRTSTGQSKVSQITLGPTAALAQEMLNERPLLNAEVGGKSWLLPSLAVGAAVVTGSVVLGYFVAQDEAEKNAAAAGRRRLFVQ